MRSRDFVYWLQGYFEIVDAAPDDMLGNLCEARVKVIKNHLAMVFKHEIDPSNGTVEHNKELSKLHEGASAVSGLGQLVGGSTMSVLNC